MKNIHLIPTDKPSRLYINLLDYLSFDSLQLRGSNQNIYITSDEEIKEGDWDYSKSRNKICKVTGISKWTHKDDYSIDLDNENYFIHHSYCKKIILTTDQDLIKDGVQAIDDEFLEWFVKNPSCEEVEVAKTNKLIDNYADKDEDKWEVKYHIYFPKEEPKQETLEEVAERLYSGVDRQVDRMLFINGAKWQQDKSKQKRFIADEVGQFQFSRPKMYSEEEVYDIVQKAIEENSSKQLHFFDGGYSNPVYSNLKKWFEQFKKK